MTVSRQCPLCGERHEAAVACKDAATLRAFAATPTSRQAEVDAAETLALIRYRLRTRS
jgi:hypothetical protein